MKTKKITQEIKTIEKEIKNLLEELGNHPVLKTKNNNYIISDKQSFLILWKKYILLFKKIKKLIKKSNYRTFFFKINYNKLILKRYLVILYYNFLVEILSLFSTHEQFLRQLLNDNFIITSYGDFAKYIYRPRFINLINTPKIFLASGNIFISKKIKKYYLHNTKINTSKRIFLDYQNIYFYIKNRVDIFLVFISKNVGKLIAKAKFTSRTKGLISQENIEEYLKIAEIGDIILTRGNWNASNFTIPGFWKHMALYVGTGKDVKKHFSHTSSIFASFFSKKNTINSSIKQLNKTTHYIIEATGEGINIVPIKGLASHNDYMGFSRTNFSKEKINRSVGNALKNVGKSYDHLFNYYSDKNLVCSELVLKSYAQESEDDVGISIDLKKIGISLTFPPNNFIDILQTQTTEESPQVYPVFFIDSIEKTGENFVSTPEELLKTGKRPKLSMFLK